MYNLCSQHLQSLNSIQQKTLCSTAAQRYVPDARPGAARQTWIRLAKFSMTLLHSSLGMALMAAVMAALRSGMVWGLCSYTLSLR